MKTSTASLAAGCCVAVVALAISASPTAKEQSRPPESFMMQKSLHTQKVLDALMKEQYAAIVISGEAMKKMAKDTRWRRFETDDYFRHSENFETHAQAMVDSARARNLDGAMEYYMKSLRTCYDCHKYVRVDRAHGTHLK